MGLTKAERDVLLKVPKSKGAPIWSKQDIDKLLDAIKLKITPKILADNNIFPGKTCQQIRDKYYKL